MLDGAGAGGDAVHSPAMSHGGIGGGGGREERGGVRARGVNRAFVVQVALAVIGEALGDELGAVIEVDAVGEAEGDERRLNRTGPQVFFRGLEHPIEMR